MFSPTSQPIANDRKRQVIGETSKIEGILRNVGGFFAFYTRGYVITVNS
ncbi:hypothetical protein VIBNISO65_1280047 [Vibrio nigripulchritudo SO65]|nr:hypothetical protein VIBNIAM115_1230046 [Vibrio nigripulchritudo AM115]CCN44740.1 hypothetical protein VIBNIFTn2_890045 [Vibrio nigripulchritudo FTn2]CCN62989.1 hypothetical protein VIBNIPon4_1070014 [Vibrio nigripulchritudo POn4]CCN75135.1 hypothetical protein VIBNISO65_1280047 [Vibrio nigripulchritudo SO65]